MKPTFILCVLFLPLAPPALIAAPQHYVIPRPPEHIPQLLPEGRDFPAAPYNAMLISDAASKTAGTASRITGQYLGSGMAAGIYRNKDSVHYQYSGIRGGDLNGNINFDEARYYRWDSLGNAWKPTYLYNITYDLQNRPVTEIIQSWIPSTSTFANSSRLSFQFNAQGRPTLLKTENWNGSAWSNYLQYTGFNYNSAGNPLSYMLQVWSVSSGKWVNNLRYTATYNAHGDVTSWLTEVWNATSSVWTNLKSETYAYNSGNKNTGYSVRSWDAAASKWHNDYMYNYHYNGSNQAVGYTKQTGGLAGTIWLNTDSVGYSSLNAAGSPLTQLGYSWVSSSWQPTSKYSLSYTSKNLQSSSMREDWNGSGYTGKVRDFAAYNSFGQLASAYEQTFNGNIWTIAAGDRTERYAYQSYAAAVAAAQATVDASIYPIPANSELRMKMQWQRPQPFSVAIYDIAGRLIAHWTEEPVKDYTKSIAVDNLSTGAYLLKINGTMEIFQKPFTVRH